MGKKKPVKDLRGYAFAANMLNKPKEENKPQPVKSSESTEDKNPSEVPVNNSSSNPSSSNSNTSPSPISTPSSPSSSSSSSTSTTSSATPAPSSASTSSTSTPLPAVIFPPVAPSQDFENTPDDDVAGEDDVIDVDFVRAARSQRSVRGASHDDEVARMGVQKSDVERLPYLALEERTEHTVLQVLKEMGALDLVDTNEKVFAQRTLKKLNLVYTSAVEDLGFSESDVEQAMRVTGGFPLSVVLDWLCINVATENMPAGFADKMYFNNANSNQIEVTVAKLKIDSEDSAKPKTVEKTEKEKELEKAKERQRELEREKEKAKEQAKDKGNMKSWIMQYAQDEDEEDDDDDLDLANYGRKPDPKKEYQKSQKGKGRPPKTEQAKPEPKKEAPPPKEEDDESDMGLGLDMEGGLGMFDEEAAANLQPATVAEVAPVVFVDMTTPKSWTGKTPKTCLLDWNRNKIKAANVKLRGNGLKYNTTKKGGGWQSQVTNAGFGMKASDEWQIDMPEDEVCATQDEAENYVSTIALYKYAAGQGVHRILPPVFRSLWSQWENDAKEQYSTAQRKKDEHRVRFLKEIMQVHASKVNFSPHLATVEEPSLRRNQKSQDESHLGKSSSDSKMKTTMQSNFEARRKTKEYEKLFQTRKTLPIYEWREEIIKTLEHNQVLIVSGETGSGKSTQVPQYIVESFVSQGRGDDCNVICTQPRRISALSLAARVSLELGDGNNKMGTPGSLCGYQIRLESKIAATTRLTYCTTGIALRRLEDSPYLDGVSHIIVDEVHERTLESDFLLIVLKKILAVRPDLRVVLMSATINAEEFSAYFNNCPIMQVSGRTFPVTPFYLEDVVEMTKYTLEEDSEYAVRKTLERNMGKVNVTGQRGNTHTITFDINDAFSEDIVDNFAANSKFSNSENSNTTSLSRTTLRTLSRYDEAKVNFEIIEELLRNICLSGNTADTEEDAPARAMHSGAILVFLPGIQEIRQLFDSLVAQREFGDEKRFWILPLHSSLTSEQQVRVFDVPSKESGIRKIVLSTNIAETGITIPDCTVVIDTGRVKQMSYDERKSMSVLQESFISKANAKQRRGRAGRVQEGVCFHFTFMPGNQIPEILRLPLEELCLKIKVYGFGKIADFLSAALSPPTPLSVNNAIENLVKVQALSPIDESLTPLGSHLSSLPVDVHVGKMILFGAIFKCLDPILTIAACISFKSPFVRPFGKEDEADKARNTFKTANSDFLSLYSVYLSWREKIMNHRNSNSAKEFCRKYYCSFANFSMIEDLKRQLLELLVSIGFVDYSQYIAEKQKPQNSSIPVCTVLPNYNTFSTSLPLLNAVLTAGLYPKILLNTSPTSPLSLALSTPSTSSSVNSTPDHTLTNLQTKTTIYVHPASLNHNEDLKATWYAYHTMVKSTKVFVWDCNAVASYPLFLFSGDIEVGHALKLVSIDKSFKFKCYAKTAVIFKRLRSELNAILKARINDPGLHKETSSKLHTKVISIITNLLESEYDKEKRIFVPIVK